MALVLALLAALAQDADVERLRKEVDRLRAELAARDLYQKFTVPLPTTPLVKPPDPPGGLAAPRTGKSDGKVTAVANEIGLLVLSIGQDDGVRDGREYLVYRNGVYVAQVVVDRSDKKWSAARIVMKNSDPRVGDDVVSHGAVLTPATPPAAPNPLTPKSADSLREIRKELDDIRRQVRTLSDQLVPSWSGAGVAVEEASEDLKAHLGIDRGLVVRRVREGSAAEKAGLRPLDLVPRVTEAKLLEALEKGEPVEVLRKGKAETLRR